MLKSHGKTLAIIGAGPKGLAIAVKASVLAEFGFPVDTIILIEKNNVAANWSGEFGYTNGEMKLGTSPEKDVVFPIEINVGDDFLNQKIRNKLLEFTWTSFLISTDRYSDWVDRGRPAPCHAFWAHYLKWVSLQLKSDIKIINGHVQKVDLNEQENKWELHLKNSHEIIYADKLMVTGPGETRSDFIKHSYINENKNCYNLESFWSAIKTNTFKKKGKVAIIGAGENSASALLSLAQYDSNLSVDVIAPKGFISTRAENFYENQFYSQPERNAWHDIELTDRKDFIKRTDIGVFSTHAMEILNEQKKHTIIPGRVVAISSLDDDLILKIEYSGRVTEKKYKQIILATGFDYLLTISKLLTPKALHRLRTALHGSLTEEKLIESIESDLSVKQMEPKLFLPMLAGINQGPGFANLSCLGKLSDRILNINKTTSTQLSIIQSL